MCGSQKCCKDLANTRLDLRNAANIREGGATWGPIPWGVGTRGHGTIHIYIYIL